MPIPSLVRWSTIAKPMPPDCMTRPTLPAAGLAAANVASSPIDGTAMPKQLGPISRIPCLRQAASRSAPTGASMAAVSTTRPRTPRRPQASAVSTTAERRHGEHREVGRLRQARDVGEAGDAADFPRVGVDRVEPARESPGLDVVQDRPADRARLPARPDHRDRLGREHRPQAGHVRGPLADGDRVQVVLELAAGVVGRQRDRDGDHAVLALAHHRQARVGEDPEHAGVLLQRLGGQRLELLARASETRCSSSSVAMPRWCMVSATANATSAVLPPSACQRCSCATS